MSKIFSLDSSASFLNKTNHTNRYQMLVFSLIKSKYVRLNNDRLSIDTLQNVILLSQRTLLKFKIIRGRFKRVFEGLNSKSAS